MKESREIFELNKFKKKHKIEYDKKTEKWSKPFHNVLGIRWLKSENGFYNKDKDEKGCWENYFVKWKLGYDTYRLLQCGYCFKKLKGNQRRYCSHKCRVLATQIRNKVNNLGINHVIYHSEKRIDGHLVLPDLIDFTIKYPDGTKKRLTEKKGKPKQFIDDS